MKYMSAVVVLAGMLASCSDDKRPEYLSAKEYVIKYHSYEEFLPHGLKLQLHDVLGAEGPYAPHLTDMGVQGNANSALTVSVKNDDCETRRIYQPTAEQDFFVAAYVINPQGENAVIIMKTFVP